MRFLKASARSRGFTLVEIMIVVAIIALLAAIAVPNFMRARKRSQATQILEELRVLEAAADTYMTEYNKSYYTIFEIGAYLKKDSRLYSQLSQDPVAFTDLFGNPYIQNDPSNGPVSPPLASSTGDSNPYMNVTIQLQQQGTPVTSHFSVSSDTVQLLSDVVDSEGFWGAYLPRSGESLPSSDANLY